MITFVETLAMIILLILMVLLISHLIQGDALKWIKSKFTVAGA